MSTLEQVFAHCCQQNRAAFIGYLPAGFPDQSSATAAMVALVQAGADIVEVGVPYSDPLIDGPLIAQAVQTSLESGTTLSQVLDSVREVSAAAAALDRPVAVVLMSYWNVIEQYGPDRLAADLAQAGGAGVITPDLIPEEAQAWVAASSKHGLSRIFLVAPSSSDARLALTVHASSGFLYAASTMGVTGTRQQVGASAHELVQRTRAVMQASDQGGEPLPICVGVGVSTAEHAAQVAQFADGVIVGSALVRQLTSNDQPKQAIEAMRVLAEKLSAAVHSATR